MRIADFIDRWSGREGGAERANYALFLSELTDALDLERPHPADSRSTYRFEYPVEGDFKQKLRIDLYKEKCFILEAKQSRLQTNPFRTFDKHEALIQEDLFGHSARAGRSARRGAWEADMQAAFRQARDYAHRLDPAIDRPPFLITCDVGRSFELYADFSGQGRAYRPFVSDRVGHHVVALEALHDDAVCRLFRQIWAAPKSLDPALKRSRATRDIADPLAALTRSLESRGHNTEAVALFLSRILFILFAKDVGLLPADKVMNLFRECHASPRSFPRQMTALFTAMDSGGFSPALDADLQRFNGAFFRNAPAFELTEDEIGVLVDAAGKDWRAVEPAVFGTLLEHALDRTERGQLGAHYTPRAYVERLVQATVMAPLRKDWDIARAAADAQAVQGDHDAAVRELRDFHERLTAIRMLDPACGTGNFLYVALELMFGLETEVIEVRRSLGDTGDDDTEEIRRGVDPRQFLGLEISGRAAVIAELVLWIGYLQTAQLRQEASGKPRIPVLRDYGTINPASHRRTSDDRTIDALLVHDGPALGSGGVAYPNPRRSSWPEAHFIVGNPPFLGGKDIRSELGDAYAEALWAAHPAMNDSADLVMYWWDHAADILTRKGSALRRFGFVTTNSVTQVFARRTIARWLAHADPTRSALSLAFAIPDHPWTKATKDAAAVRIAMTVAGKEIGDGELARVTQEAKLDSDQPEIEITSACGIINADLTIGADVTRAMPLIANDDLCSPGVKLHGSGFIVSLDDAKRLGLGRADRPGLENHIRPYRNGRDLTGRSRDKWVIDLFGLEEKDVRRRYPEVYDHVTRTVRFNYDRDERPKLDAHGRRTGREWNARASYKDCWWTFGEPRRELRSALAGLSRYVVTVETSKHRTFKFLESINIPDNMLVVIASESAYIIALLSSQLHTEWAAIQGGTLEDRPRYSKSRCFDTFPFPDLSHQATAELSELGEGLDAHRKARLQEHPDLTLTRMYNALEAVRAHTRDPSRVLTSDEAGDAERGAVHTLAAWHDDIDRVTLAAYGWSDLRSADGRFDVQTALARLVALNAERRLEETRGQVRWLRAGYQAPRSRVKAQGVDERQGDLEALLHPMTQVAWPRDTRPQLMLIRGALAEASVPLTEKDLAARFKGRGVSKDLQRLLTTLAHLGQIRHTSAGYTLLRAA